MASSENYEFTVDWFSSNVDSRKIIFAVRDAPTRVIEIGSYEDRSTTWITENLMTRGGRLVAIDSWGEITADDLPVGLDKDGLRVVEQRFDRNIAIAAGAASRYTCRKAQRPVAYYFINVARSR